MQTMTNHFRIFLTTAVLILTVATTNAAATFTVTNTNDSGAGSLRQAITDANTAAGADTIVFDASFNTARTIGLAGTVLSIGGNDALTITGPAANLLTVSGNNVSRVFQIESGIGQVTISGMTITGGNGTTGTSPGRGGAILNSGNLTLTSVVVTRNTASLFGGGISSNGNLTINNSTISNNNSDNQGGGILFEGGSTTTLNITNSTVSGNTTRDAGGGLAAGFNTVNITGSTFSNNSNSQTFGGGGISFNGVTATVSNSTISGNTAAGQGGGAIRYADGGTLTLTNTTIANNTTPAAGGGILLFTGTINLRNSILANSNGNGGSPDIAGSAVNSQGYNLIRSTMGANITGDTATNITGLDPQLAPLANNGGPTFTHALTVGSPAIDKGESSGATADQRGVARPSNNASIPNAADGADIGAFEVQVPTAAAVTIGGRVLAGRRGVARARVTLTGINGETRTALTNPFGYYRFEAVGAGETYVFNVHSKRYSFNPLIVTLTEELTNLDFTAQPEGWSR